METNTRRNNIALVIGNQGLGDSIVLCGIANYLATKYDKVIITCIIKFYEQVKLFYKNSNIIPYPIDIDGDGDMYTFTTMMMDFKFIYDIYPLGNYGADSIDLQNYTKKMSDGSIRKIIQDYPLSYYQDIQIPTEYMTEYFEVDYPKEVNELYNDLLQNYKKYRVIHQEGSNVSINIVDIEKLDIENMLTIDINKNIYPKSHKYHDICERFVNLKAVVYYKKLLENATELYLIDSCIHALALIADISNSNKRICYQRESRFNYGIKNKFLYRKLVFYA